MSGNDKPAFGNADGHPSDGHIDDDGAPDTCSSPEPENSDRNSFDAVTEDDDIPWPECRRDVLLRVAECRRDLLLTVEDVSKAARNVLYMMSMFDLQYVDKPLRNAIDPSLKRF
jgi:hypothetical protein